MCIYLSLLLLSKHCFVTWLNGQTLLVKRFSNIWQTVFDSLASLDRALLRYYVQTYIYDQLKNKSKEKRDIPNLWLVLISKRS